MTVKFTFKAEYSYPDQPHQVVTIETDAVTRDELLVVFADFLRGCGFHLDNNESVEIVSEECD